MAVQHKSCYHLRSFRHLWIVGIVEPSATKIAFTISSDWKEVSIASSAASIYGSRFSDKKSVFSFYSYHMALNNILYSLVQRRRDSTGRVNPRPSKQHTRSRGNFHNLHRHLESIRAHFQRQIYDPNEIPLCAITSRALTIALLGRTCEGSTGNWLKVAGAKPGWLSGY